MRKTNFKMKKILFFGILMSFVFSCVKEDEMEDHDHSTHMHEEEVATASIRLMFDNAYGGNPIEFNTPYVLTAGDTIQIAALKYIISDVVFTDSEGHTYAEPNSYHIVKASGSTERWGTLIENVPTGSYTKVSFRLGIAQNKFSDLSLLLANHSQAEVNEMLANNNTAYYNLKLEGNYSSTEGKKEVFLISNTSMTQSVHYTFGEESTMSHSMMRLSHSGDPSALDIHVMQDSITQVHFQANLNYLFNEPTAIDFDNSEHTSGDNLNSLIHKNYSESLFMLHHSAFE